MEEMRLKNSKVEHEIELEGFEELTLEGDPIDEYD
jgi:hypothetical protein